MKVRDEWVLPWWTTQCHLEWLNPNPPAHQCRRCLCHLLDALVKPTTVSTIHCPGHQEGKDSVAWGSNKADKVAREMAMQEPILVTGLQETATGNWDWTKGCPHLECTAEEKAQVA